LLYNFSVNSIIRKLYQEKWMKEIEEKYLKDILNKQFLTIRDRLERENILKRQKLAYFLVKKLKNENEKEYGDLET
jgi:acyl-homoserine lactone acylase PvdQ